MDEGARLERECAATYRGFESHSLRHTPRDPHIGLRRPRWTPDADEHRTTLSLLALWCLSILTMAAVALNSVAGLLEAL